MPILYQKEFAEDAGKQETSTIESKKYKPTARLAKRVRPDQGAFYSNSFAEFLFRYPCAGEFWRPRGLSQPTSNGLWSGHD